MDEELFQALLESVSEAGAVQRGEREAARRTSISDAGNSSGALATVQRTVASRGTTSAARLADLVFRELTGIEADELRELLLGRGEMPARTGARRLRGQLAELMGCRLDEASALLGASASRVRGNDRLSRDMLDRAYAIVGVYVHVATVLGPRGAAAWFAAPNAALDGAVPRRLLETSYGRRLVRDLVDALLAGSYV